MKPREGEGLPTPSALPWEPSFLCAPHHSRGLQPSGHLPALLALPPELRWAFKGVIPKTLLACSLPPP